MVSHLVARAAATRFGTGVQASPVCTHFLVSSEMVILVREPENPYDRWAIRVDNVRNVKVGHLPRKLVCFVSCTGASCPRRQGAAVSPAPARQAPAHSPARSDKCSFEGRATAGRSVAALPPTCPPARCRLQLSPLVDQGKLYLEGLVPRGTNNVYKMPVHLYAFCECDGRICGVVQSLGCM